MTNPLLEKFHTPHETAPFNEIMEQDFAPAFKKLIEESLIEIDEIVSNSEEPTFENVIVALAFSGE